jgi:hypothetical protein
VNHDHPLPAEEFHEVGRRCLPACKILNDSQQGNERCPAGSETIRVRVGDHPALRNSRKLPVPFSVRQVPAVSARLGRIGGSQDEILDAFHTSPQQRNLPQRGS